MRPLTPISILLLAACSAPAGGGSAELPGEGPGPRVTRWGTELDPERILPEYPRPTLVREQWRNLNGRWQFEVGGELQPPPQDRDLTGEILVPFPVESDLSGVGEHHPRLWYKRQFEIPEGWRRDRVLLHFGAVDWECEVWVNGIPFPVHHGGYEPFHLDVTDALLPVPRQELLVRVFDPTDGEEQMVGKQRLDAKGIWYTPVSGIWQTVWIEPVPRAGIDDLLIEPDLETGTVTVTALGEDPIGNDVVEVEVLERGGLLAARRGGVGEPLSVPIPAPRAWSPEDPFLYDLQVTRSAADGRVRERVESYFGLRSVALVTGEDGIARIHLNGEPLFLMGVLDQGWWPDGLYTAPADQALRYDVATTLELGFNLSRKHVKVEPERWYAWCDRLGLLVWQDMPNGAAASEEGRARFEAEVEGILRTRRRHPSIVGWVLFNEGWGQYDTERLTAWLQELDPTRTVTCASGWNDAGVGHILDQHNYPGPVLPPPGPERASVLGEYGGLGLPIEGHLWSADSWGYRGVEDADGLAFGYECFARDVRSLAEEGLAAAIYTQLTDVATETNGLLTYDRAVVKTDTERIARANRGELVPLEVVLPTSERVGRPWRYRTAPPTGNWNAAHGEGLVLPGPEDVWLEGIGGFGNEKTPGSVVRTAWESDEIWLVGEFSLAAVPRGELLLRLHHDEDVEVWINGTSVLEASGFTRSYELRRTGLRAEEILREGINRVSAHVWQTDGGQYIDLGIEVLP